jgi:hypothetical protein
MALVGRSGSDDASVDACLADCRAVFACLKGLEAELGLSSLGFAASSKEGDRKKVLENFWSKYGVLT